METPSLGQPFWNATNSGYGGRRPSPLGRGRHLPVRLEGWLRENSLRIEIRNAFTGVVRFFFGRLWLISYNHDRKPQLSDSSFFCDSSTSWTYQRIYEWHHPSSRNGRVRCVTRCSYPRISENSSLVRWAPGDRPYGC